MNDIKIRGNGQLRHRKDLCIYF